jgi:hypothetical protein
MDTYVLTVLALVVVLPIALTLLFVALYYRWQNKIGRETQRIITDKGILELIRDQPDGFLSTRQLAEKSGLTHAEAKSRLLQLRTFGAVKVFFAPGSRAYYSLTGPTDDRPVPQLSPAPFLTVDDLLKLFRHFGMKITPQQLIMATGLPLNIIEREIKYFIDQKILQKLSVTSPYTGSSGVTFILQDPYRSDPDRFLEQQLDLNQEMETILRREDLV